MECAIVECTFLFLLQLIWSRRFYLAEDIKTSIHLFKVRWYDHCIVQLWNQYRDTLHLTFSESSLFRVKCLSLLEILIKWEKVNYISNIISKRHNILPTKIIFLIFYAGKSENVQELKMKLFQLLLTDKSSTKTVLIYQQTWSFSFLRQYPFFKMLFIESTSKLI